MKMSSISFFDLAAKRMDWLAARQEVISENIANADTPGFRAREVTSFQQMLDGARASEVRGTGLAVTQLGHIQGSLPGRSAVPTTAEEAPWETTMDGNTVVLEQQIIKATESEDAYRLAADLYRKGHELLTLAATGGR